MKKLVAAALAAFLLVTTASCQVPDDGKTAADRNPVNSKKSDKSPSETKTEDKGPKETVAQQNARESAASYLDMSAYSRQGLIDQLKYEDFSTKDATYGVDAQHANWRKQAAASAQTYLDMSSYSRQSLIDQLKYEGYTQAQAVYGVNKVGL